MLRLTEVLKANEKQFIKNFKEWKRLINSKNPKDIEALEGYRKEFAPYRSETTEQYVTSYTNRYYNYLLDKDLTFNQLRQYFTKLFKGEER